MGLADGLLWDDGVNGWWLDGNAGKDKGLSRGQSWMFNSDSRVVCSKNWEGFRR